jgi:hypothetical protein
MQKNMRNSMQNVKENELICRICKYSEYAEKLQIFFVK